MKKLGLLVLPMITLTLFSCSKGGGTSTKVEFSVTSYEVTYDSISKQAIVNLDWTPSEHSLEFSNVTFTGLSQGDVVESVVPGEVGKRPMPITITFNDGFAVSDQGNLNFHYFDKTSKKEGEGKVEGISVLKNTYDVRFEGQFCTINGDFEFNDSVIKDKENAKYTIVPSDGYNLPETIGMPDGITYQYDKNTGVINIDKVTKNINKITATAVLDESYCAFHFEGTNCNISGIKEFDDTIEKGGTNVKYTISPDIGYKLPTNIDLEEGSASYDNTTGVISISEMTSNISITASTTEQFEEEYNISFSGTNCTATGEGITSQDIFNITATNTDELQFTIAPTSNYELTDGINFKINNVTANPGDYSYVPDGTTGKYILKFNPKGETVIGIEAEPKKVEYKITFDSNGGSAVQAISVIEGGTTNPPTDPTRSNYAFDGWYYDDDTFEYKFDFSTTAIYENVELHAKWVATNIVTLTFDAGAHALCEINFERKYELPITKGTKWQEINNRIYGGYINGLEFLCWTLDGYTPMADGYVFNESATLYARYVSVSQEYFTFTPRINNATLTINPPGKGARTFSYQKTGDAEPTLFTSGIDVKLNYGQQIYIKGYDNEDISTPNGVFIFLDCFSVSGLCGSLFKTPSYLPPHAFQVLFKSAPGHNNALISAHNLLLPETTLESNCYYGMFQNCSLLMFPPKLFATILAEYCYFGMFVTCTNLKVSNSIPAENQYNYIEFLTTPSTIPDNACSSMFLYTTGTYTGDPVANGTYYYYN